MSFLHFRHTSQHVITGNMYAANKSAHTVFKSGKGLVPLPGIENLNVYQVADLWFLQVLVHRRELYCRAHEIARTGRLCPRPRRLPEISLTLDFTCLPNRLHGGPQPNSRLTTTAPSILSLILRTIFSHFPVQGFPVCSPVPMALLSTHG